MFSTVSIYSQMVTIFKPHSPTDYHNNKINEKNYIYLNINITKIRNQDTSISEPPQYPRVLD